MTTTLGWITGAVVILPLAAAGVLLLLRHRSDRAGWTVTIASLGLTAFLTILLVSELRRGAVRYEMGGIPSTYGIELVADPISSVLVVLTLLVVIGAVIHTRRAGPRNSTFYSGVLLLTGGTLGIILAGDMFNLYVFLEISAIASYALIASAPSRISTYAALKYLLLGTLGASLYLLGVAYVFIATGTLNMVTASNAIAEIGYTDTVVVSSFILMAVGLAIKIALFPVHTWLADAHASAPDAVSAIVSGVLPAVAVYALARITYSVYTPGFFLQNPSFLQALLYTGILTVLAGSVFAILQRNIKLILAYSTISHMGLAIVGVALASDQAVFGATVQLFGHGVVKAALFLLAGIFALVYSAHTLEEYTGLAKRSPILAGAFTVLGISLIGLPPTVGFMGKYYIVLGALETGAWLVAAFVISSTLLSAAYIFPIINRLYFYSFAGPPPDRTAMSRASLGVVVVGVLLTLLLGVMTVPASSILSPTIEVLLG